MKNRSQQAPLSVRPKKVVMDKIRKVAEINGLPISTVANMCLASGIFIVDAKLSEMGDPNLVEKTA